MESMGWADTAKGKAYKPPVRLGFMYMPHGVIMDRFWPKDAEAFRGAELPPIIASLALLVSTFSSSRFSYNPHDKGTMTALQRIQTDDAPGAIGPYSQGIIANGFVYTAGQIPLDPATMEIIEGDITISALKERVRVLEAWRMIRGRLSGPAASPVAVEFEDGAGASVSRSIVRAVMLMKW